MNVSQISSAAKCLKFPSALQKKWQHHFVYYTHLFPYNTPSSLGITTHTHTQIDLALTVTCAWLENVLTGIPAAISWAIPSTGKIEQSKSMETLSIPIYPQAAGKQGTETKPILTTDSDPGVQISY